MNSEQLRQMTCCFTGHRPEKLPWRNNEDHPDCEALKLRIAKQLNAFYVRGYRHFITGMARGTDLYFAEEVLDLREHLPGIQLEAAVPCSTQTKGWSAAEQARYQSILDRCDLLTMVQEKYDKYCMLRRNRYMVEHSSLLLAVYDGRPGGTRYTISYAMDCGLEVVKLEL